MSYLRVKVYDDKWELLETKYFADHETEREIIDQYYNLVMEDYDRESTYLDVEMVTEKEYFER